MPYPPYAHIAVTVRTAQRVSPGALLIALAVGHRGNDFDRTLDDASDLGQGLLNQVLDCGKRLGRLHTIIANPLKAFGKDMLDHASNEGIHVHRFPFHPLRLMGAIMIGDAVAIIAVDAPE